MCVHVHMYRQRSHVCVQAMYNACVCARICTGSQHVCVRVQGEHMHVHVAHGWSQPQLLPGLLCSVLGSPHSWCTANYCLCHALLSCVPGTGRPCCLALSQHCCALLLTSPSLVPPTLGAACGDTSPVCLPAPRGTSVSSGQAALCPVSSLPPPASSTPPQWMMGVVFTYSLPWHYWGTRDLPITPAPFTSSHHPHSTPASHSIPTPSHPNHRGPQKGLQPHLPAIRYSPQADHVQGRQNGHTSAQERY